MEVLCLKYISITYVYYLGVYFTATLLTVYSQALLKMPGPRIRQWLEEAGMGKADWYRSLSASVPAAVAQAASSGTSEAKFIPDDWVAFVKGWINCATGKASLFVLHTINSF